jgi:hypothetical protein
MSKKTAAALVILISCFVGLLYPGSNGDQDGTEADSVVIPVRTPVNIEAVRVEKSGKEVANRSVRNSDHSVARPIGEVPPSDLRKEARCFLANCEAARSKNANGWIHIHYPGLCCRNRAIYQWDHRV